MKAIIANQEQQPGAGPNGTLVEHGHRLAGHLLAKLEQGSAHRSLREQRASVARAALAGI
jgi:hypothetical protein